MQKRFCSCGNVVLVNYLFKNGKWVPLFVSTGKHRTQRRHVLAVCPGCGSTIDIHSLR